MKSLIHLISLIAFQAHASEYILPNIPEKGSACDLEYHFTNAPTVEEFKPIFADFQKTIENKDWEKLATEYMSFPFVARKSKKELKIKDKISFVKHAPELFSAMPAFTEFQKMDFFCNYQGLMLFNGYLWLTLDKQKKLWIKAINYRDK
jgi:hypothetical protein